MLTQAARTPQVSENDVLRAMFVARKEVFVDLLKWDLPVLDGRFEIDQFDTPAAHYLILADGHGRHRASARLLPSDRPHLLGDLYPYLCDGLIPRGPSVREITRFCLDRHQTASERCMARNQLVTALAEHALAAGITDYTGVAEVGWLQQILLFGWQCRPLGRPVCQEGRLLAALHIQIDGRTIEGLKRAGIYEPPTFKLFGQQETVA